MPGGIRGGYKQAADIDISAKGNGSFCRDTYNAISYFKPQNDNIFKGNRTAHLILSILWRIAYFRANN